MFWDEDYRLANEFPDLPHEIAVVELKGFGIASDYFLAVPDDPNDQGVKAARQELERLLR